MSKQAAFLRAINVGGHAAVRMSDLKHAFELAGCVNVATYIQSGNVLFDAPDGDSATEQRIRTNIAELLGGDATVLFRTVSHLEDMMKAAPFDGVEAGAEVKLYVAFLSQAPSAMPKLPLVAPREGLELVRVTGLEAFVVSRKSGNGRYGFPNNFIELLFGVPATTRNWTTVSRMVQLSLK